MTSEELERLYMDLYDNGIPEYDYKEKFKRYVNNRFESLEKEKCELLGIIQGKDKAIADLKKENAELKSIANFQTSSNMDRYFQLKRSKEQLAKAKEIIKGLIDSLETIDGEQTRELTEVKEAEQFLSEVKND